MARVVHATLHGLQALQGSAGMLTSVLIHSRSCLVAGSIDRQSQLLSHDPAPPGIEGKAKYGAWR